MIRHYYYYLNLHACIAWSLVDESNMLLILKEKPNSRWHCVDGTTVGTSSTVGAEQRRDRLWLARAWPSPTTAMAATWKEVECVTEAVRSIHPCRRACCLRGSPRALSSIGTPCMRGTRTNVRLCVIGTRIALIVVFLGVDEVTG
jgi:hypothetical protein